MTEAAPEISDEQRKEFEEKLKNMSPEELMEFQKQQCIFCQIISGKIPSKKVYEDEKALAILDINPAAKGHILIIPKEHYAIMPQMPAEDVGHLFILGKKLSQVLLRGLKVSGTNLFIANGLVAGQKAQHFMLHVIPRGDGDGILQLDEKLIEKEMNEKVQTAVENKLNELLGVKKKVVRLKEEKQEEEPEEESEEDPMKEVSEAAQDEDPKKPEEEVQEESEAEDSDEDQEEDDDSNDDENDQEDSEEEDIQDSEDEEDNDDSDEDDGNSEKKKEGAVDLDDIANLFK